MKQTFLNPLEEIEFLENTVKKLTEERNQALFTVKEREKQVEFWMKKAQHFGMILI